MWISERGTSQRKHVNFRESKPKRRSQCQEAREAEPEGGWCSPGGGHRGEGLQGCFQGQSGEQRGVRPSDFLRAPQVAVQELDQMVSEGTSPKAAAH